MDYSENWAAHVPCISYYVLGNLCTDYKFFLILKVASMSDCRLHFKWEVHCFLWCPFTSMLDWKSSDWQQRSKSRGSLTKVLSTKMQLPWATAWFIPREQLPSNSHLVGGLWISWGSLGDLMTKGTGRLKRKKGRSLFTWVVITSSRWRDVLQESDEEREIQLSWPSVF